MYMVHWDYRGVVAWGARYMYQYQPELQAATMVLMASVAAVVATILCT